MTAIDYDHSGNVHTLEGARAAIPRMFEDRLPDSVLDVGCGSGTWMCAAAELGIGDVVGIDGIGPPAIGDLRPSGSFHLVDLNQDWSLGRRFDAILCLEVAEHLNADAGSRLLDGLVAHSDTVFFSAACPGQPGQHHINCQWPEHWQRAFNERGFVCNDEIRWKLWSDPRIEVWYRQNLFIARRSPNAGNEPRIASVIHPEFAANFRSPDSIPAPTNADVVTQIEHGLLPFSWYCFSPIRALWRKSLRRLTRW